MTRIKPCPLQKQKRWDMPPLWPNWLYTRRNNDSDMNRLRERSELILEVHGNANICKLAKNKASCFFGLWFLNVLICLWQRVKGQIYLLTQHLVPCTDVDSFCFSWKISDFQTICLYLLYKPTHYCGDEKSPSKLFLKHLDYSIQLNNTAVLCLRKSITLWIFNMYENQWAQPIWFNIIN